MNQKDFLQELIALTTFTQYHRGSKLSKEILIALTTFTWYNRGSKLSKELSSRASMTAPVAAESIAAEEALSFIGRSKAEQTSTKGCRGISTKRIIVHLLKTSVFKGAIH